MTKPAQADGGAEEREPAEASQPVEVEEEFDAAAAFDAFVAGKAQDVKGGTEAAGAAAGEPGGDSPADPSPQTPEPKKPAKGEDLWAGVPEELRDRFDKHIKQVEKREGGRVSRLQRELNETRRQLAEIQRAQLIIEVITFAGGELFGVVQSAGQGGGALQYRRRRHHRPGQRAAPGLVHAADNAGMLQFKREIRSGLGHADSIDGNSVFTREI